jgi:hypothetical protein
MKHYILLLIALLSTTITVAQQHDHMTMDSASHGKQMSLPDHQLKKQSLTDTAKSTMIMSSQLSLDLPMTRNGSGTS